MSRSRSRTFLQGWTGLRILHVADTHFPANGESLERFLATAKRLEYDIVLATGDYAESADGWPVVVEALRRLDPGLGIFASLGGHERYAGGPRWRGDDVAKDLLKCGAASAPTSAGVDQPGASGRGVGEDRRDGAGKRPPLIGDRRGVGAVGGDRRRLDGTGPPRSGVAAGRGPGPFGFCSAIRRTDCFTNGPVRSIWRSAEHTHGGQIRFPLIGAPVRHARSVQRHAPAGLLRIGGVPTYVSRGFGTTLLPFRLGAPPELAVLELRRAERA